MVLCEDFQQRGDLCSSPSPSIIYALIYLRYTSGNLLFEFSLCKVKNQYPPPTIPDGRAENAASKEFVGS